MQVLKLYPAVGTISINTKLEAFCFDNNIISPPENYIVSRDTTGKTVSIYKDDIWDFVHYRSNEKSPRFIYFEKIKNVSIKKESKRLIFLVMVYSKGRSGSAISTSTLISSYFSSLILPLSIFLESNKLSHNSFFESSDLIYDYIKKFCTSKIRLQSIRKFLILLDSIDNIYSGIDFKKDDELLEFLNKKIWFNKAIPAQTDIIPSRVLSESLRQRWLQIDMIEHNIVNIQEFMKNIIKVKHYAVSEEVFNKFKNKVDRIVLWRQAVEDQNLKELFDIFHVYNKNGFRSFIKKVQGTCKHLIHAYSGMRDQEVISLKNNCIELIKADEYNMVRLIAITTKLDGYQKEDKWVTTKEILRPINILNKINESILGLKDTSMSIPLFLSPKMIVYCTDLHRIKVSYQFQPKDQLNLDDNAINIKAIDIKELEDIDYTKDYENHKEIKIGKPWIFKSHQYRRSLAIYAIQSGLVSLGSLQIQLKHLFKEMTLYYGNGASQAKKLFSMSSNHISSEMNYLKPEIDALSYIKNIIFSDELLFGAYGTHINNMQTDEKIHLLKNRKKTIKQFTNGDIAYKETALGACVSTQDCEYTLTHSIVGCGMCENAIIKKPKLYKVIQTQKDFIRCLDKNSVEYRTEVENLKELEKQKKLFLGDGE